MKSMIWKELREQARWMPIGLLLVGLVLQLSLPGREGMDGMEYGAVAMQVTIPIFILLAMALGFLQSIPDNRADARAQLLHRPIERGRIFRAKWMVGAALYFSATLVPLGMTAIWLEVVGPETRPTTWLQAFPAIAMAFACFAFYFAAMWSIYRPARWFGTRLLPMAMAAGVPLATLAACAAPPNFSWGLGLSVLTLSGGLAVHALAARHAFCRLGDLPPASHPNITSRSSVVGFLAGGVVLSCMLAAGLLLLFTSFHPPSQADLRRYAVTADGHPWQVDYTNPWVQSQLSTVEKRTGRYDLRSDNSRQRQAVPDDFEEVHLTHLYESSRANPIEQPFRWTNVLNDPSEQAFPFQVVYDRFGRLLCYDRGKRQTLRSVITPDGFFLNSAAAGYASGFEQGDHYLCAVPGGSQQWSTRLLFVDRRAVHLIHFGNQTVEKLLDAPNDAYATTFDAHNDIQHLWLKHGHIVSGFTLELTEEKDQFGAPMVSLSPLVTLPLPSGVLTHYGVQVAVVDGGFVALTLPYETPAAFVYYNQEGQLQSSERFADLRPTADVALQDTIATGPIPPFMTAAFYAVEGMHAASQQRQPLFVQQWRTQRPMLASIGVIMLFSAVAAGLLTFFLTGRRGRPWQSRVIWTLTAVLFSWSAVLAVMALFPRVLRQRCSHCDQPRRIDRPKCEHCQNAWEGAQNEGMEIFERVSATPAGEPLATLPTL